MKTRVYALVLVSWSLVASFSPQSCVVVKSKQNVPTRLNAVATSSSPDAYLRWKRDGNTWKMQTAVTSFQQGNKTVELHAQLHFGDKSYFDFYNSNDFNQRFDHVHYELLVDDELLKYKEGAWKLEKPIMASANDQNIARSHGWECQASRIDYTNPKWIHADLTRQEFLKAADKDASTSRGPLWKLAGPESSSTAAEAVSALLVGPPTLSYSTPFLKRRLFTNLFIPGESFANSLRAVLWMTVPSPELSIILLDWSSLLKGGTNPNALSQVLVSSTGSNNNESSSWSLLVSKRNDHALKVLQKTLSDSPASSSTALLYGSSHCPDLHSKLNSLGYRPTKTTWRTAWSVQESEGEDSLLPSLLVLGLYLIIGALDWVGAMGDFAQPWIEGDFLDAGIVAVFYLVRHVLLYLALSNIHGKLESSLDVMPSLLYLGMMNDRGISSYRDTARVKLNETRQREEDPVLTLPYVHCVLSL
eukprot:scaffold1293_cov205-Cylindrotheca_fusiformis.AAC.1